MSTVQSSLPLLAAALDPGAGGASAKDLSIAGAVAAFAVIVLLMGGLGHRSGLVPTLGWFERFSERVSGQPGWSALPCGLAIMSLLSAVFGLYWDVATHLDSGRDKSVWGNPGHIFILAGLYGIFAAGFFAICLGREERADRPGPTAIRITGDWYAPLGGVLMTFTGLFSLAAFPLDDFWHRLFGQDVTLWGPTHLMLIGGAVMTLLGIGVLQAEALRAMRAAGTAHRERGFVRHLRVVWLPGGLLVGMSTFQGEFDYGIPQFQLLFHPMLIMLAAGLVLVLARIWLGRVGLWGGVAFYLLMRGGLTVLVHGPLDESIAHFPLYVVEAACVEAAAALVAVKHRPLAFAAVAGALIGSVGLAAEWAWSHVWMPLPWPAALFPEAALLAPPMAVAGALLGAWIAGRLDDAIAPDATRALRPAAVAASLGIFALLAFGLVTDRTTDARASVALTTVQGGPQRTATATVTLTPRNAADGATWLTITSWQGGGHVVVDRLTRVAEGVYRSNRAFPVHGTWKTLLRLHTGDAMLGLPIYAPRDTAIPRAGIPAPARFARPFESDRALMQREARTQATWIWNAGYGVVLALALGLVGLLAWGLHRIGSTAGDGRAASPSRHAAAPAAPAGGLTALPARSAAPAAIADAGLPAWAQRPDDVPALPPAGAPAIRG